MARILALIIGSLLVVGVAAPVEMASSGRPDVQRFVRAYVEASNSADPTAVMEMVSKRPEVSSITMGAITRGWDAIRSDADALAGTQGTHRMSLGTMEVVLMGPGHALVVVPVTIDLATVEGAGQLRGAMTLVLERSAGAWKMIYEHSSLQFPQADVE